MMTGSNREKEYDIRHAQDLENMRLIHEAIGSGQWKMQFDASGEMISCEWDDVFRRMLGYVNDTDFPDEMESWTSIIYREDKQRVLNAFWSTVNDYSGRTTYDVEYRLNTKNRGVRWFRAAGRLSRRIDGTPITFIGLFIDIDDNKRRDREFAEQFEIIEALSRDYMNIFKVNRHNRMVSIIKQDGFVIRGMNRQNETYPYDAMLKKYISERVHPDDRERLMKELDLQKVEDELREVEEYVGNYRILTNDGLHYFQYKFLYLTKDEDMISVGFKNIDSIMKTAQERDNLKQLSETDIMTGLLNRGSGEKKAGAMLERSARGMLLICDIDKFKSINDTYGHGVGDKVIISIASLLKSTFRDDDIVFRLGGDEFSVLALNVNSMANGRMVIDRLFEKMESLDIPELGERKVTLSIGAAMTDGVFPTTFEEMYKKADSCVYESKKSDGNMVNFYS